MMKSFSGKNLLIEQQDFQQILIRGKGDGSFAETVNKEISLLPPSDNLTHISGLEQGRGIIDTHDPIIVFRDTLGYFPADFAVNPDSDLPIPQKNRSTDTLSLIHI